jgi:hypothetical protein
VNAIASHHARRVGLTLELLLVPTLPRLGIQLAIIARADASVVVAVTMPHAHMHALARLISPVGWAGLAGFWQLGQIWPAKPKILSIFILIKSPLKFLQTSKIYINSYKIQKNTN